jgi:hypothetical protein
MKLQGTEVEPYHPRDPTLQIPIDMGVPTGALVRQRLFFDINRFKIPFNQVLLFLTLLLFYRANKLRTNEKLYRKEIDVDK